MKRKYWLLSGLVLVFIISVFAFGVVKLQNAHDERVNAYYYSVKRNESFRKQQAAFYNSVRPEMLRDIGAKPGEIEKMGIHFYDFTIKRGNIIYLFSYEDDDDFVYSTYEYDSETDYKNRNFSFSFVMNSDKKAKVFNNPRHFNNAEKNDRIRKGIAAYDFVMKKVYENWSVKK